MAYWIYADDQTVGPLRMLDILNRATPETLVSYGLKWIEFAKHPDFAGSFAQREQLTSAGQQIRAGVANAPKIRHEETQVIPCEDSSVGFARGLIPTLCLFLFNPNRGFKLLKSGNSVLSPVLYSLAIISLVIGSFSSVTFLAWTIFNSNLQQGISAAQYDLTGGDPFANLMVDQIIQSVVSTPEYQDIAATYRQIPGNIVAAAIAGVFAYMLFTLLRTLVTHFIVGRSGASKAYPLMTMRIALYSSTTNILIVLSLLAVYLYLVRIWMFGPGNGPNISAQALFMLFVAHLTWTSILEVIGFRQAYGLKAKQAALAVGVPYVAFLVVTGTVVLLGALVMFGIAVSA